MIALIRLLKGEHPGSMIVSMFEDYKCVGFPSGLKSTDVSRTLLTLMDFEWEDL